MDRYIRHKYTLMLFAGLMHELDETESPVTQKRNHHVN